jgi:hypothetical protein
MSTIYIHSTGRDFAPTQYLPEPAYLGRCLKPGKLTYFDCGCNGKKWMRVSRLFWMRVVPFFRHYKCLHCGLRVFRPRVQQRGIYSAVYIEPTPILPRRATTGFHGLRERRPVSPG